MRGVHRPKQPALVREAILREASALAIAQGIQSLTLRGVAEAAGVTKGGLMHHFTDKSALVAALRERAITLFSDTLNNQLDHEQGNGRFTRAYIRASLATTDTTSELRLIVSLWGDPQLRTKWYEWLRNKEAEHAATDGAMCFQLARLAADGAWLATLDGADPTAWEAALLAQVEN